MKAKLGGAAGVTATAHKLARILYALLTHGEAYVRQGLDDYEQKHRQRKLKHSQSTADAMGFNSFKYKKFQNQFLGMEERFQRLDESSVHD